MPNTDPAGDAIPLRQWRCDRCPELITDPAMALVVWRTNDLLDDDFLIVHKGACDPEAAEGYICNLDLDQFLGPDGLTMLLSWLSIGPIKGRYGDGSVRVANFDRYVDLVRRVQIPWYEQARSRFDDEDTLHWLSDANEYYPYMPDVLERTAKGTLGD